MTCVSCQRTLAVTDLNCPGCGAPVGALAAGTRLHHQYRVEQALPRSGGQRYVAVDEATGGQVLLQEFCPPGARRFGLLVILDPPQQAQRAAWAALAEHWQGLHSLTLRRPGRVFEQNGTTYVVSPLPAGVALAEHVERLGPLPGPEVERLVEVLAEALEELCASGSPDGPVSPERVTLTSTGVRLELGWGAEPPLPYRAPEQMIGPAGDSFAGRMYGLGAVATFALTGQAPPAAAHRALGVAAAPLPPGTPRALRELVTQALALQPGQRPGNLAQVQGALRGVAPGGVAAPESSGPRVVEAHRSWVTHVAVGEDVIVTAGADQQVRVFTLAGEPVRHLDGLMGRPVGLAVLPGGIVAADARGRVHVWAGSSYRWADSEGALEHCAAFPAGPSAPLVTVSDRPALGLWRMPDVHALGTAPLPGAWITALGTAPSGAVLYGTGQGEVVTFEPQSMTHMPLGAGLPGPVRALVAGPGGQVFAAAGGVVWQLGQGTAATFQDPVQALALTAEGVLFAAAGRDVYRLDGRGASPERIMASASPVRALACAGDLLVAGTETGTLLVLDTASRA